jgi:RNA polymerase sigma factor for flagellar operon FliA
MLSHRNAPQLSRNRRVAVKFATSRQTRNDIARLRIAPSFRSQRQKKQLIMRHLPLIKFVVHRIATRLPKSVDSNDLINTGVLGLIDAATKFDASHNVQFKTYAELRIRGAILDSLRQLDWAPRSLRQKGRLLERATSELTQRLGREAEDKEVASALGLKMDDFQKMRNDVKGISFGQFQSASSGEKDDGESRDLIEFVPADGSSNPHLTCERSEMRQLLGQLVGTLPRKERLVVALYYYEELSMKEIGSILLVNESRVSQLHQKAMFLLKRRMKNTLPELRPAN